MIRFYGTVNKEGGVDPLPDQLLENIKIPKFSGLNLLEGTFCEVKLSVTFELKEVIHLYVDNINPVAILAVREGNAETIQKLSEIKDKNPEVDKYLVQDVVDRLNYCSPEFLLDLKMLIEKYPLNTETLGVHRIIK